VGHEASLQHRQQGVADGCDGRQRQPRARQRHRAPPPPHTALTPRRDATGGAHTNDSACAGNNSRTRDATWRVCVAATLKQPTARAALQRAQWRHTAPRRQCSDAAALYSSTHTRNARRDNEHQRDTQTERERSETAHSLTRADSAHGDTALCGRRRKPAPRHATRAGAHSAMHMGLQIWRRSNERQYATPDHSRAVQRSGRSGSHCPRDVATVRCIATSLAIATIILCDHNRPPPQPRSSTPRTPRRTGSSLMCRLWPVKAVCARALLSTYESNSRL
jgi:hypothetical protein